MAIARTITHLTVSLPTKVGLLAEVSDALSSAGVDIRAISASDEDGKGVFMIATSDDVVAEGVLAKFGATTKKEQAVAIDMPDQPGALAEVARTIAKAGVNIDWMYATTNAGAAAATGIFHTADNAKVVGLF